MSFKQLQKLYISPKDVSDPKDVSRVINTLQQNVQDSVNPMAALIQNDSIIVSNIALTGPGQLNIINHTLGRPLIGWIPIRVRNCCLIWDGQDFNKNTSQTLWLYSMYSTNIDLLLF
jgi:hypothetical protein